MNSKYTLPCNIAQTLNIIGDKWTLLILHELSLGHNTYKELQDNLDGISSNLLSTRLKELEADCLIKSELYQNHPPRYKYQLTDSGADLSDVFLSLVIWGEKHLKKCYKRLVHSDCGEMVEQKYYCPKCGKIVDSSQTSVVAMDVSMENEN